MEIDEDIVIVGAGIAGLATAVALKRVGVRALVLEKSQGLRTTGTAITLAQNAWLALDALGVAHKLISLYEPLKRTYINNLASGEVQEVNLTGIPTRNTTGPRCVHRRALLEALAEELPIDSIRFSSKITDIETFTHEGSSIAVLHMEDGTAIKAKILIGCDGVHSVVAQWLGLIAPVHSGRSAVRSLSVFPQGHGYNIDVYQFLDEGKRGGFVPLNDKEIYWFMIFHSSIGAGENMERDPELMQKNITGKFAKNFPQNYLEIVQHSDISTISWAPLMLRLPWGVIFGNVCKNNVTVAGDAMHPMTPDLGQGGCLALEDAVILGRHIGNSFLRNGRIDSKEVARVLEMYVKERRWRTAGLIAGSYLSGWIQQGTSRWLMKILRDTIFYKYLLKKILEATNYDCGKLPSVG